MSRTPHTITQDIQLLRTFSLLILLQPTTTFFGHNGRYIDEKNPQNNLASKYRKNGLKRWWGMYGREALSLDYYYYDRTRIGKQGRECMAVRPRELLL